MAIRNSGIRYDVIARDSASRTFRTIGDSAGHLDSRVGKLGKTVAYAGAALAGGFAGGLAVSADKAVRFETELTKVQTQAGGTARDVAILDKSILGLGKSAEQGPQQLSEAMYHLKSVGLDNVSAMKDLKVSSDLAAVGSSDLEDTTNALAGAWRTGIKGAGTFAQAAGTVNAVLGAGNMRMEDFVGAIGTGILPSAKAFGLSLNQVGAALALMTDEGIPAVDAATRLRMSFSLLGAPSKAADKQLATIGLTGLDLAKAMRGPDGIIGAVSLLKTHLDDSGLSAARQSQILSRSFGGGRSSSGILTLLNNLDVLRLKQDQVNKSMGKFPSAVEAQRKTAAAQLSILKSNLDVVEIEVGQKVLPTLAHFATFLTTTALPDVYRFGRVMAHDFIPVDQIRNGFSTAEGLVDDFFKGFKPKARAVTLPTPTLKMASTTIPNTLRAPSLIVPSPTVKVGTTHIPSMLKAAVPQKSDVQKFGEQLRGLISGGIGDAVDQVQWGRVGKQIGTRLGDSFGWIIAHGSDLSKKLADAIGGVDWVDVGKTFGSLALPLAIGFVDNLFAPLFTASFWEKHWLDAIVAVVSVLPVGKVFSAVGKGFSKLPWGRIGGVLDRVPWGRIFAWPVRIGSTVAGAVRAAGSFVDRLATGFGSAFASRFPRVATFFYEQMILLPVRLGDIGRMLMRKGSEMVTNLGSAIVRNVPGMGNRFIRATVKILGRYTFYQTGINLVQGLLSGVGAEMKGIGGWIEHHIVDPVVSWTKDLFGVHSPSTVFASVGGDLISGLKGGVIGAIAGVGKWLYSNVVKPVVGAFDNAKTWLSSAGGDLVSGLIAGTWSWLSDKGHSFAHWAGMIKDKIVGAIVDVFKIGSPSKVMMEYGGHIMAGLQHGLLSGKKVLHSVVKGLFHSPLDAAENLLKNGVSLPGRWIEKLLSAKTPVKAGAPLNPGTASAQNYASGLVSQLWPKGAGAEMDALRSLWNAESGWRANAQNMSSGAYGIPQALPASKMASAGSDWRTNAATQIRWGLSYIRSRYGDPETAWASWNAHRPHWYAKGGLAGFGETAWVGEQGPELMQVTNRGTRIFSNPDSMAIAGGLGMQVPGYAKGTVSLGAARQDVAAAQRQVTALERQIAALRHDEATAHTKRQRKRDQLAVMAAEQELKAARTRLTAANRELSTAQAQAKRVQGIANTLQNGFLRTLETGSAVAIASAVKSLNSKLQTAGFGSMVAGNLRTSSRMQSLANQRSSVQSQIAAAKQFASDQASGLGDFLSLGNLPASSSLSSLISRMQASQGTAAGFTKEVAGLSARGLDKSLIEQLGAAGPGSQLAKLFLTANGADIAQLNKLAASQAKLTTSFGRTMADAMYDTGSQAGKGFLSGLVAQEKQIQSELNRLADGMVKEVEHKLGIKSPSTVFRDRVGKQVALGTALGVRIYTPHAVREAARMADTMAAVRARSVPVRAGAAAVSGGGEVHHHEHTHYEVNARTADFTPQQLEVLQRKAEARQRVGRPR